MPLMLKDLRHAIRMLAHAKAWTTVVVLSLGLGIGANAALFSAVNGMLLTTIPVRDPDTLVRLRWSGKNDMVTSSSDYGFVAKGADGQNVRTTFSYPMFQQLVADNGTMTDLFACAPFGRAERRRRRPGGTGERVHLLRQLLPDARCQRAPRPRHRPGRRQADGSAGGAHQLEVLALALRHRPVRRRQDAQDQQRRRHDCRRPPAGLHRRAAADRRAAGHLGAPGASTAARHRSAPAAGQRPGPIAPRPAHLLVAAGDGPVEAGRHRRASAGQPGDCLPADRAGRARCLHEVADRRRARNVVQPEPHRGAAPAGRVRARAGSTTRIRTTSGRSPS